MPRDAAAAIVPEADADAAAPRAPAAAARPEVNDDERRAPLVTVARARRPRQRSEEHINTDRWLVSYADFVTLLFAFFVVMYAISRVDAQKLAAMVDSMQHAFQTPGASADLSRRPAKTPQSAPVPAVISSERAGFEKLRARLAAQLQAQGIAEMVDLEIDDRGLVISIREVGSFAVGSAELSPSATTLLGYVGNILTEVDNDVRVEGHTDDVPIHTAKYTSNWALSADRATNVVAYLIEHAGARPDRVSVAGYAEYRPRIANTSAENRARNRRVDLVILNAETQKAEAPRR